jgi:hypothetical protein
MNWIEYRINEAREKKLSELDPSNWNRFGSGSESLLATGQFEKNG